jgi:hypothetical protein
LFRLDETPIEPAGMKQLTQKIKDGSMQVLDAPVPDLKPGMVLVRNLFSLISAGTEGDKVTTARKGYIGKAKEKPQQVKQVVDTLRTQGAVQTYRAVMKKLDAYTALGYSCVGEVIGIGEQNAGMLEYKNAGMLECWNAGTEKDVDSWMNGRLYGNRRGNRGGSEFRIGDLVACGGGDGLSCGSGCCAG